LKKFLFLILLGLSIITVYSGVVQVQASVVEESNEIIPRQNASLEINEIDHMTNVVIFIRFQDEASYEAPYIFSFYENMFNGTDVVSLRNYFLEVSYGQMDITSVFATTNQEIVYYVDSEDRSYYEEYDAVTNPNGITDENSTFREHELLKRAIDYVETNNLIDDSIDLDVNADGEIDSISFLVSGEDQGWNSLLWPHKWSLYTFYDYSLGEFKVDAPTINNLNAYTYTFELLGNTKNYDYAVKVAILAHETFHLISSPDLYHYYDYSWIDSIGYWGLMSSVSSIPNHMLGYMKETYGNWIQSVDEITASGTYTLYPLQDSADNLYRINTGYSNEYVYLEYRDNAGLYESNLPSSGLLVYRVDGDYENGNVDGYYDSEGNPQDEVFIFRPGITDIIPPITFEDSDNEFIDEDGDISKAALSDSNLYDEMGNDTSISMFYSDGSLMDLKIYNVVEHDGYITFDVYIPPIITLQSNISLDGLQNLYLVDAPGLNYYVDISNIPVDGIAYYTLDGTTPNLSSAVYTSNPIEITALNNQITTAIYVDGELMSVVTKSYQFASTIESEHFPYGNEVVLNWYIHLNQATDYDLIFDSFFELEIDYDFLSITDGTATTKYTGIELQGQTLAYNNNGLLIQFISDLYEDNYYGFISTVFVHDSVSFDLVGNSEIDLEVFDTYEDAGYSLTGTSSAEYYVQFTGSVDSDNLGDYTIEYLLYNSLDILVNTITRTIHVIDTEAPEITLTGDSTVYVEYNEVYTEEGATYSDNYDVSGSALVSGNVVLTDMLGTYTVQYNVMDSSGNVASEVTRTVIVQDTIAPSISLNPSLDTIEVGMTYTDYGVTATDNTDTVVIVEGVVDINTPGVYVITYHVKDTSDNETIIVRYVIVYYDEEPVVEFTLDNAITTIQVDEQYTDGTCSVNINGIDYQCTVKESNVDTTAAGVYTVTYIYTYNNQEYTYIRYVFVVDGETPLQLYVLAKKEDGENL